MEMRDRVVAEPRRLEPDHAQGAGVGTHPLDEIGVRRHPAGDAAQSFAEAHRAHQPATFQYFFTYGSPAMRGALGACHGLELPFVFGALDVPGQAEFAGRGAHLPRLSERMMDAWLAFTRTGDPGWPAYESEQRPTMVFDLDSALMHAPYEEERAAWDDLTPRPL